MHMDPSTHLHTHVCLILLCHTNDNFKIYSHTFFIHVSILSKWVVENGEWKKKKVREKNGKKKSREIIHAGIVIFGLDSITHYITLLAESEKPARFLLSRGWNMVRIKKTKLSSCTVLVFFLFLQKSKQ